MKVDNHRPDVSIPFTPEEMKDRRNFNKLLDVLMDMGYEIRIGSDGYCTIVEAHDTTCDESSGYIWFNSDLEDVRPAPWEDKELTAYLRDDAFYYSKEDEDDAN